MAAGDIAAFTPVLQNGQTVDAVTLMAFFNSIRDAYNGNITANQLSSAAEIAESQLNLAALSLENLIRNGGMEQWNGGTTVAPDEWELVLTPTIARDTAEQGAGSYAAKITGAGAADEGIKQTITNLKASTTYRVSVRLKVDTGDTASITTTGATTNMDENSSSTSWATITGTFVTDGSGTDVVLQLLAQNDTDVVYFDRITVTEGTAKVGFIQSLEYLTPTRLSHSIGYHKNLIIKRASVSTVDIDADDLMVDGYHLTSVNLTADITGSGANGLDTGSEAGSTAYYVWVIYDPVNDTVASLLSISATAPTLPTGYTNKRLVGYCYNDSGSALLDFYQSGEDFYWAVLVVTVSNASNTSITSTAYGYEVPSIAKISYVMLYGSPTGTADGIAYAGWEVTSASIIRVHVAQSADVSDDIQHNSGQLPNADGKVYYYVDDANMDLDIAVAGFKFPL